MSCVDSIYWQKGETAPVNTPLLFIHRQIASFLKKTKQKLFTAQYKTAIQRDFEAVTRCKMHCQKNPWKFPHWGNIFKSFTFSFALYFTPRSSPPLAHSHLSLQSTISPRCSYKFKDTETAVPVIWQIYKQRKTLNFSFIVTKTHARTRKKERKKKITRKQLEVNCFFLNRKALFWNIFQSQGASDQVLCVFPILCGIWLQTRKVHSSMVVVFSSLMLYQERNFCI